MATSIDPIDYKNTILSQIGSRPVSAARDYTPAYGGIPTLPAYTQDVNTVVGPDVQAQTIANLPNYQNMLGADVANITANLAGQVPADVINQLATRSAERGIQMGSPGSPNANAAYLRALGLTSMQMQQLGNQQLTQAMQRTPIQQMQTTTQVKDLGMERAQYAAAPSPQAAAQQALANAMKGMQQGAGGVRAPSVSMPSTPSTPAWTSGRQMMDPSYQALQAANAATFAETDRARQWQAQNAYQTPYGNYGAQAEAAPYQIPGLLSSDYYGIQGGGGIRDDYSAYGIPNYEPPLANYGYASNQPTSSGSMYISPQSQWTQPSTDNYYDDSGYNYWEDIGF